MIALLAGLGSALVIAVHCACKVSKSTAHYTSAEQDVTQRSPVLHQGLRFHHRWIFEQQHCSVEGFFSCVRVSRIHAAHTILPKCRNVRPVGTRPVQGLQELQGISPSRQGFLVPTWEKEASSQFISVPKKQRNKDERQQYGTAAVTHLALPRWMPGLLLLAPPPPAQPSCTNLSACC